MSDDSQNAKDNNVKATIDAVTGLAKAIPVYNDAIQPAAKEVGKSLATVARAVNIALAPVSALVWGYDKISEWVSMRVSAKLKSTAEDKIITPDPAIVGPALEALRYTGNNEIISELYANLIANAMDLDTVKSAHPGFVEIIKNMTSDEALIVQVFSKNMAKPIVDLTLKDGSGEITVISNYSNIGVEAHCKYPELTSSYLDNLCRLGILRIPPGRHLVAADAYDSIVKTREFEAIYKALSKNEKEMTVTKERKFIELTELGVLFRAACVSDKAVEGI